MCCMQLSEGGFRDVVIKYRDCHRVPVGLPHCYLLVVPVLRSCYIVYIQAWLLKSLHLHL